jgi:DNA-binding LytR/AlgR family response regulator
VFATAYDQYALDAFEQGALDYLLKPVDGERLATTCDAPAGRALPQPAAGHRPQLAQLGSLLQQQGPASKPDYLRWIQAQVGAACAW